MRLLSVRLIVSLIVGVTLVSLGFSYYQVVERKRGLRSELEKRAEILAESSTANIERLWAENSPEGLKNEALKNFVHHFGKHERLLGIAIYNREDELVAITPELEKNPFPTPSSLSQAIRQDKDEAAFVHLGNEHVHILAVPIHENGAVVGGFIVVHDESQIRAQVKQVWRESFFHVLAQVVLIALVTLLIVRWSIVGPIAQAAQWMRALRMGRVSPRYDMPDLAIFRPLAKEVATISESLSQARIAAENEARLRIAAESLWTAERLSVHVQGQLDGNRLFVVSNREPYVHQRNGRQINAVVPPSGLVTALEPVLRACDGTWIAQGAGDADMETVDEHDRLRVPPDNPQYTLRRMWLSKKEEDGYYYGFANEGLWPLCHVAHTRPIFRADDWALYHEVNNKFADAVAEEAANTPHPVVLVQDYHLALLPRMIKQRLPEARVAIFWHIPWPNPEAFGICPWQRQILDGMLGADLIGFHVQAHCNNFLQTVDRVLESRIDWEHFSVMRQKHSSVVRPFPISVDVPSADSEEQSRGAFSYSERGALLRNLGGDDVRFLGVGVDRIDYTKGILERFLAIERFLEKYPAYQKKFTFVQIGAPSRTHIKRYHDLVAEVEAEAERINWRFQSGKWKPLVIRTRQHSHTEIAPFYRTADVCMVTSLHDGMNLVAKEFVAERHDEQGVLILSQFTGAARELRDALLVNPYDIDQTAEAIRVALEMEPEEKQVRMQRMRKIVREQNIYRWAASLITDLCELRLNDSADTFEKLHA